MQMILLVFVLLLKCLKSCAQELCQVICRDCVVCINMYSCTGFAFLNKLHNVQTHSLLLSNINIKKEM